MLSLITPPVSSTLLLKPSGKAPTITSTSDPAGGAFDRTFRKIASMPQFQSQLFGWPGIAVASHLVLGVQTDGLKDGELVWDAMYFGWRKPAKSNGMNLMRMLEMTYLFGC